MIQILYLCWSLADFEGHSLFHKVLIIDEYWTWFEKKTKWLLQIRKSSWIKRGAGWTNTSRVLNGLYRGCLRRICLRIWTWGPAVISPGRQVVIMAIMDHFFENSLSKNPGFDPRGHQLSLGTRNKKRGGMSQNEITCKIMRTNANANNMQQLQERASNKGNKQKLNGPETTEQTHGHMDITHNMCTANKN